MKIACDKCNEVIDADRVKHAEWLKVSTDNTTFMLCKHCSDGFWMAVDSGLPPIVAAQAGEGER